MTTAPLSGLRGRALRGVGRVRRIPAPLAILLVLAVIHGGAWAVVTAPLNGPDEPGHVAYVQSLAENGDGPDRNGGDGPVSTEAGNASTLLNLGPIQGHPEGRPAWDRVPDIEPKLRALTDEQRSNSTGPNAAGTNPPGYYAYAAAAWKLSPGRDFLSRLTTVRLMTVLLFVLVVAAAWKLAGEVFSTRWKQTFATALVALNPKLAHTAGQVNPDLMLVLAATATLWMAVRIAQHGSTLRRMVALGLFAGLGPLTHPRGLYLVGVALIALGLALVRFRPQLRAYALQVAAALGALLVLAYIGFEYTRSHSGGLAYAGNAPGGRGFYPGEFASYVWQFYLPKFSFLETFSRPYGYRQMYIETFFGGLAHFEVSFQPKTYDRLQIGAFIGLMGVYTAAAVRWRAMLARWPVVILAVAAFLGMALQLHLTSYSSLRDGGIDIVITGRYLLPSIALAAVAAAFAVGSLPRRFAAPVAGFVLAASVLLAMGALGIGAARFYG